MNKPCYQILITLLNIVMRTLKSLKFIEHFRVYTQIRPNAGENAISSTSSIG